MLRIIAILVLFLSCSLASQSGQNCEDGWEFFEGKCYLFYRAETLTWSLSKQFCHEQGADLVLPKNVVENRGIWNLFSQVAPSNSQYWIDAVSLDDTFPFKYTSSSGETLKYNNWKPTRPGPGSCGCVVNNAADWDTTGDCIVNKKYAVCEKQLEVDQDGLCQFEEDVIFVENSIQKDSIDECRELCRSIRSCKVRTSVHQGQTHMLFECNIFSFSLGMMVPRDAESVSIRFRDMSQLSDKKLPPELLRKMSLKIRFWLEMHCLLLIYKVVLWSAKKMIFVKVVRSMMKQATILMSVS